MRRDRMQLLLMDVAQEKAIVNRNMTVLLAGLLAGKAAFSG